MKRIFVTTLLLITCIGQKASAELKLPGLFSDHAVLQAGIETPVWGWTDAGQSVEVILGSNRASTKADADGKWMVKLPKREASATPIELAIIAGSETKTIRDILIGEVWLGSGQSNMTFTMAKTSDAKPSIAAADQPEIRLFTVPKIPATQPINKVDGHWEICTPKSVGPFSAVLYHFGRQVHDKLNVPMGLIHSSWGGTPIQAWMPREAFPGGDAEVRTQQKKILTSYPSTTSPTTRVVHSDQLLPTRLFNGMINPVLPYGIRGVLWYQGENNVHQGDVSHYAGWMNAMVTTWRKDWGEGDWPFLFVQIAPFGKYVKSASALPEMWEQQTKALTIIPNSGLAAISDLGNPDNIHPTNKREVGRRLALIALDHTYGVKNLPSSPPIFESAKREGVQVRIHFKGNDGGLSSRDKKPLDAFEIAGADGAFVLANARVDGVDVVVDSDQIANPTAVRFAWSATAAPNLVNGAGLPAIAFRVDVK